MRKLISILVATVFAVSSARLWPRPTPALSR